MKRKHQIEDFAGGTTWLVFRVDEFLEGELVDVYMVMDLPSEMILAYEATAEELTQKQTDSLLETSLLKKGEVPTKILLADNDPAEAFLQKTATHLGSRLETAPAAWLEDLTREFRSSLARHMRHSATIEEDPFCDLDDESEYENAKKLLPDSYDLCSCASGLKYKFCCKRILIEVTEAMCAAEDGNFDEALDWIDKAKAIVGETAEVLCREAIVYSFFDIERSDELLGECLEINPKHPRAHYIQALALKDEGDFEGAIEAYKKAISYYPTTDHYHLNEVHNNLGNVYYMMGDRKQAEVEWETALRFLPSDKMARQNLEELIYKRERYLK